MPVLPLIYRGPPYTYTPIGVRDYGITTIRAYLKAYTYLHLLHLLHLKGKNAKEESSH